MFIYMFAKKIFWGVRKEGSCGVSAATRAPPPRNYYRHAVLGTTATQWRRRPSAADTGEDLRCEHPE